VTLPHSKLDACTADTFLMARLSAAAQWKNANLHQRGLSCGVNWLWDQYGSRGDKLKWLGHMRHSWPINIMFLPNDYEKKSIKAHLLDFMAFQYTRNGRTSECCVGSSKNISTFINSLQSNHLNNQVRIIKASDWFQRHQCLYGYWKHTNSI
jgi:hypothetical protein